MKKTMRFNYNNNDFEKLEFVDYFYDVDEEDEALIEITKERLEDL